MEGGEIVDCREMMQTPGVLRHPRGDESHRHEPDDMQMSDPRYPVTNIAGLATR